jgi:dolichyl-phosphate-mannose-protein mannosyltransferase
MIENGAILRLEHRVTEKRLHSHDVRPPVSDVEWQNEVSGYGFPGFAGDANDFFRVEIVKSETPKGVARERLR